MRGRGSVAIISTRAGARGRETPSMSAKSPVCGPAVILQRPGIRLNRALRIGMATEVEVGPPDGIVADDGYQLLELPAIEKLPLEAARLTDLGPAPRQRELRLAQGHADPVRLVLRRVAEQIVHLRPEALLFEAEGTVDVSGAPAVASGGLPAHDVLLEDEDVDAGTGKPPSRTEAGDATADDDDRRPFPLLHVVRLPGGWVGGAVRLPAVLEVLLPQTL